MGEVFAGRYELIDPLGEGGMGTVWRVWDRREQRIVAAKVLRQSDAVSLLRFVREQAVRIQHPHVLTPLGWAGEDDRVLFTMPVVDGGSVATLIGDHGPLPALFVAEVLRQLLEAVAAVHDARVLHRDIKPANVLLAATRAGRPHAFLTDFGIAVDLDGPRFTRTGEWTGTPGYAAPESREGAEPAPTADLYAVGQVAVAMLTGDRPSTPPVRPDGVPDPLWSLVIDLTGQDPAHRPRSASEALGRLHVPELSWRQEAAGDVEVLRQVEPPDDDRRQLTAVTAAPSGDDVTATVPREEPPPEGSQPRSWPVVAVVAALAVLGGLVLWSPWSDADLAPGETPVTTHTTRTTDSAPPKTTAPPPTSTSSPESPSAVAPPGAPTTRPGTVRVGPVVSRVGQPCEFSDVGLRETTTGGVAVVCARQDDGSYRWTRR